MTTPMLHHFNAEKAEQFRKLYQQAAAAGDESFMWEGKEVLTSYAKYVCEFFVMQGLLKPTPNQTKE